MTDLRNLPDVVRARLTENYGVNALTERHKGFDIDYAGKTLEHRATRRIELRSLADGAPEIVGYATVYDHAYDVAGGPPYGWSETIARGAADKSVAEQDEVYMFFDHGGMPLAATKAGTLTLESDKVGLYNRALPDPTSQYSMEIVSRIRRRELDAESFAFRVIRQEWNGDYTERRILEVQLFDTSVVSFPASPFTIANVRHNAGMTLAEARALLAPQ